MSGEHSPAGEQYFDPVSAVAVSPFNDSRLLSRASTQPVRVGHRGAAGTAPENTLIACEHAVASGVEFIEADLQLSADGVPFVFHDYGGNRTTNIAEVFPDLATGPITSLTWDQLQQLDAGAYFHPAFTGEKIPSLAQILELGPQIGFFLEIKAPQFSPGIEQAVANALTATAAGQTLIDQAKVQILGFDPASNRTLTTFLPHVPVQQLLDQIPSAQQLAEISQWADSIGVQYRGLDAAGARRVREAGMSLGVWTVNEESTMRRMISLGVDSITSDYPRRLMTETTQLASGR